MTQVNFTWTIYREDKDGNEQEIEYDVECEYSHDPGVRTFRNGDPGYPPSTEAILETIKLDGKEIPYKQWAEHGFDEKEISKVEDDIVNHLPDPDDDGDAKYDAWKDGD